MAVPLYVITGFLGSGKTTLLKQLLVRYADSQRIAVVQNEFADVNVDARELYRTGKAFHLLEINRGSVFCICLIADFTTSLAEFIDHYAPDAVFLEASGLADPIAVAEILTAPSLSGKVYLANVWCIVDAASFLLLERGNVRLRHQVQVADLLLLNKTDLVDEPKLQCIEARLREINPAAPIVRSVYCATNAVAIESIRSLPKQCCGELSGRPEVGTAILKSSVKVERRALEKFLEQEAASAWRIKGYVRLSDGGAVSVQAVFGKLQVDTVPDYTGVTQLVVIGPEVKQDECAERFRRSCEKNTSAE
ncbi:MAG: GTP-binding protein [candidate division KSB1 bacterium]|nr:GTP-binding protein [candidate division KSB1 bacterium]